MATPRKPKQAAEPAATPPAAPVLPEWLQVSPEEIEYKLLVIDWNNGCDHELQDIALTRNEYASLRLRLAELRGIQLTPEVVNRMQNTPLNFIGSTAAEFAEPAEVTA